MKIIRNACVLFVCAVAVIVFAGCGKVGNGTNYANLSSMIEARYPTVVSIESYDTRKPAGPERWSVGSGVIIHATDDFSIVATNAHVVGDNKGPYDSFFFINWSKELYEGKLDVTKSADMAPYISKRVYGTDMLHWDLEQDIAIIKITKDNFSKNFPVGQASSLRSLSSPLRVGEPIAALGFSLGRYYRTSVGVVSQVFTEIVANDEDGNKKVLKHGFMHDATALQGNSGGPVFDADGKVVGLSTLIVPTKAFNNNTQIPAAGFSVALSSRVLWEVLDKKDVRDAILN
jgi:putative serine protease PepD